jgi:hypothetical protein
MRHRKFVRCVVAVFTMATGFAIGTACLPPGPPTRVCYEISAYSWCYPLRDGRPAYGFYSGVGGMVYGDQLIGTACLFSNLGYGCMAEARGTGGNYWEAYGPSSDVLPIVYWEAGVAGPPSDGLTTVDVYALA